MFQYKRVSTVAEARVSGPGTLWTVNINNGAASAVLTVYDGTDTTGATVAIIDASTKSSHAYGVYCHTGIYLDLSGGTADVTVGYA